MSDILGVGDRQRHDPRGTGYMVVGTAVAALGAYGFQVLIARSLGTHAVAPIAVLWTLQFLAFTTLFMPMEQLTIRRLSAEQPTGPPWRLFLGVIVVAAVAAVGFTWIALDRLLDGEPAYLAIAGALIVGYGGYALGRGYLAGNRRFTEYGLTTMVESLLRLALAALLLWFGAGTIGLAWTLVAGALAVYVWKPFALDAGRSVPPAAGTTLTLTAFVSATAASQTLLAAGPLAVGLLGGGRSEVSIFFETFLLFRAPLTVAYSLIARVLPPFTRFVETGRTEVLRLWAIRLGLLGAFAGITGFVFGRLVGPAAVALLLGEEFRPTATLAGYAAAGAAIATIALFTQQMLIALRATNRLAFAWITGLGAAAVTVAIASGTPAIRVGFGFLVGEVVAFSLIVGLILAKLRSSAGT